MVSGLNFFFQLLMGDAYVPLHRFSDINTIQYTIFIAIFVPRGTVLM